MLDVTCGDCGLPLIGFPNNPSLGPERLVSLWITMNQGHVLHWLVCRLQANTKRDCHVLLQPMSYTFHHPRTLKSPGISSSPIIVSSLIIHSSAKENPPIPIHQTHLPLPLSPSSRANIPFSASLSPSICTTRSRLPLILPPTSFPSPQSKPHPSISSELGCALMVGIGEFIW